MCVCVFYRVCAQPDLLLQRDRCVIAAVNKMLTVRLRTPVKAQTHTCTHTHAHKRTHLAVCARPDLLLQRDLAAVNELLTVRSCTPVKAQTHTCMHTHTNTNTHQCTHLAVRARPDLLLQRDLAAVNELYAPSKVWDVIVRSRCST